MVSSLLSALLLVRRPERIGLLLPQFILPDLVLLLLTRDAELLVQVIEIGDDRIIFVGQILDSVHVVLDALEVRLLLSNTIPDLLHALHVLVVVEAECLGLLGVLVFGQ